MQQDRHHHIARQSLFDEMQQKSAADCPISQPSITANCAMQIRFRIQSRIVKKKIPSGRQNEFQKPAEAGDSDFSAWDNISLFADSFFTGVEQIMRISAGRNGTVMEEPVRDFLLQFGNPAKREDLVCRRFSDAVKDMYEQERD